MRERFLTFKGRTLRLVSHGEGGKVSSGATAGYQVATVTVEHNGVQIKTVETVLDWHELSDDALRDHVDSWL